MKLILDYEKNIQIINGKCHICENKLVENEERRGQSLKTIAIDHDHKTNKVRGLLCKKCNSLLGFCDDNILILKKAIEYLENNEKISISTNNRKS